MTIRIKRVYEPASAHDGFRVLVDRVWPRGMTKQRAAADLWLKEVAPSDALRKSYCHEVSKWEDFKAQYFAELDRNPGPVGKLLSAVSEGPLTLLYSAKDDHHNQAAALRDYLLSRPGPES